MQKIVYQALKEFPELTPNGPKDRVYKAIILIFPKLSLSSCYELIDQT